MKSLNSCLICGESNHVVIEEHHKLPRRYGGPDSDINTILLCANCHRALEHAYDNEFWEFAFQQLCWSGEVDSDPPDLSRLEREVEKEIERRIRYDLVCTLREEGKSHTAICSFLDELDSLETISQQRVSQLLNTESFEDAYTSTEQ